MMLPSQKQFRNNHPLCCIHLAESAPVDFPRVSNTSKAKLWVTVLEEGEFSTLSFSGATRNLSTESWERGFLERGLRRFMGSPGGFLVCVRELGGVQVQGALSKGGASFSITYEKQTQSQWIVPLKPFENRP